VGKLPLGVDPMDDLNQAFGEQRDIEDIGALLLFIRREQVEQQCRDALGVQRIGDRHIA